MIVSTILDFILIKKFSIAGASFAVFFTNVFTFIVGMYFVPKIIELRTNKLILPSLKAIVAAALMGLIVFYLKNLINTFVVVALGGLLYFVALFIMGGFKKEDIQSIINSFVKK